MIAPIDDIANLSRRNHICLSRYEIVLDLRLSIESVEPNMLTWKRHWRVFVPIARKWSS